MATYCVSKYDPADEPGEDGGWQPAAGGVPKWGLRPVIRGLRRDGYSGASIRVEEEWWK